MKLLSVLQALAASSFAGAFVSPGTKASLQRTTRTNAPAPLTFKGVEASGCILLHEDNDCAAFLNQKASRDAVAGNDALSKTDGATKGTVVLESETATFGSREVLHCDKEYVEFLDKKALRNAIAENDVLCKLDGLTTEIIMFESETVTLGSREVVFEQGDESDAVYVVKSGGVEIACNDGDVLASLGEGNIFGELGVWNDAPRCVGATSSTEGASLWKLKSSSFDRSLRSSLMEEVAKNPRYEGYMAEQSLKESVRKCPIFKRFNREDLRRCIDTFEKMQFANDEIVFRQGDDGDAMYFVESGTFQAETNEGEIVAFLGEGEYFGELALVFGQPRALSIRAIGDCVAWKISEEYFNNAVQGYALSETALSRLKEKYEEDTLVNTLRRSPGELYDLLHRASRPKTRKSSAHSTISVCSTFAAVMVLFTMLAPGFDDLGYPQLFRYNQPLSTDLYIQVQMVVVLQMLTSVMGVFRLPKNSPRIRTVGMTNSAAIVLQLGVAAISNLNGTDIYLFDAYSLPFKILCLVINAYAIKTSFELVDVCVGDVDTKGWYSVPAAGNRFTAAATSIFFASLVVLQLKVSMPLLGNKEESLALASAYASTYGGSLMVNSMATNVFIGVGAFLGTMQFEKKITQAKSTVLFVVLAMILMGDGLKFVSLLNASPECFPNTEYFTEFLPRLEITYHVYESGLGLLGLVVVNALRRLMSERLKGTGDLYRN